MKYIKEWLAEPTTATQYLIDGDIDWDVVPKDDIDQMIFSLYCMTQMQMSICVTSCSITPTPKSCAAASIS